MVDVSNLRPFDLSKALDGDPVVTRYGEKATDFHIFSASPGRVYGVITDIDGEKSVQEWCAKTGRFLGEDQESLVDLFMTSNPMRSWWFNVYRTDAGTPTFGMPHETKEIAESQIESGCFDYVDTIEVMC
jgi:hypothetical protein